VEIPDFKTYITLPASGDGYGRSVVTHQKVLIPKAEWDQKKKAGIILLSEDWLILRKSLAKNCIENKCKQAVGALDGLFSAIDQAIGTLPLNH
jgi:hypothetical protein